VVDTAPCSIGVTNDLSRRLGEHRAGTADAFTKKYRVYRFVHVERFDSAYQAITREKHLKKMESRLEDSVD